MNNDVFKKLLEMAVSFLGKKAQEAAPAAPEQSPPHPALEVSKGIDWADPACQISKHFKVKEALLLPSWSAYHSPSDQEKLAIKGIADKVELAIDFLSKELGKEVHIDVHAW